MTEVFIVIINEARGDLPSLHDVCHFQLSKDATSSIVTTSRQLRERLLEHVVIASTLLRRHLDFHLMHLRLKDPNILFGQTDAVGSQFLDKLLAASFIELGLVLENPLLEQSLLPLFRAVGYLFEVKLPPHHIPLLKLSPVSSKYFGV